MGTRAMVIVKDENNNKIIEMYKQFDGYPEGLGVELQEYIASREMVNGLRSKSNAWNGINCFAASLVEHFKNGPGGIYLYPPDIDHYKPKYYWEKYNAEYLYIIDSNLNLKCYDTYLNEEINLNQLNKGK